MLDEFQQMPTSNTDISIVKPKKSGKTCSSSSSRKARLTESYRRSKVNSKKRKADNIDNSGAVVADATPLVPEDTTNDDSTQVSDTSNAQ